MNYSFKNKLFHCTVLIISLMLINISCKEKIINKTVIKNQDYLTQKFKILDSCSLFNSHISINENKSREILIKLNGKVSTRKIVLNNLNFSLQSISKIDINCSTENKFQLIFSENIGNNYYSTYHLFEIDSISKEYQWYKIYKIESTRQGISMVGTNLKELIAFKNYDAQENENLIFLPIYSFTGFQENKNPTIEPFYNKIKSLTQTKNNEIELYGDKFVLEYLTQNIAINSKNLSKYNDIAYYLEQLKLYDESIFLLEKIIEKFPNRTVAYLNLGDAYWGNKERVNAKKMYKNYIKQMKEKGKETKIPKQVLERIE